MKISFLYAIVVLVFAFSCKDDEPFNEFTFGGKLFKQPKMNCGIYAQSYYIQSDTKLNDTLFAFYYLKVNTYSNPKHYPLEGTFDIADNSNWPPVESFEFSLIPGGKFLAQSGTFSIGRRGGKPYIEFNDIVFRNEITNQLVYGSGRLGCD